MNKFSAAVAAVNTANKISTSVENSFQGYSPSTARAVHYYLFKVIRETEKAINAFNFRDFKSLHPAIYRLRQIQSRLR